MSAIAQQESLIKESLFHFIKKNVPTANLSVIDDIALSYVISILEIASQDSCFDVEGKFLCFKITKVSVSLVSLKKITDYKVFCHYLLF